ncbi:hypothetical protein L486_01730 [Kwoniella mangroviensis CBS 10435]|uniref:Uncharacterized protein n=1 Tax=Kwoniella mangroviensis CBS 10435 TaxID=1331196 RepID=A0A1B9J327_9TREE|nr:hypothetical protein L486_01730 [Kwoniella mangroviensis CBS 10435]
MASLIVLSGVVGYYLYKEKKDRKERKLHGKDTSGMTSPAIATSIATRQNKLGKSEHYEEIPPTYQNALISPPAQYAHEPSYGSSNENDSKAPKSKNKRRSRFFRKPLSLEE